MKVNFDNGATTSLSLFNKTTTDALQRAIDSEYPIFVYGARPLYARLIQSGIKLNKPFFDVELATKIAHGERPITTRDDFNGYTFDSQFNIAKDLKVILEKSGNMDEFNRRSRFDLVVSEVQEQGIPCDMSIFEKHELDPSDSVTPSLKRGYRDGRIYSTFITGNRGAGRLTTEGPAVLSIPRKLRAAMQSEITTQVVGDWNSFHYSIVAERTKCSMLTKFLLVGADIPERTYQNIPALRALGPITKEYRKMTKSLMIPILNGGQASTIDTILRNTSKVEINADEVYQGILSLYPGIKIIQDELREAETITTIKGRKLDCRGMKLGQKMALYLQGSEVDLLQETVWRFRQSIQDIPNAKITLLLHDAVYVESPSDKALAVAEKLYKAMTETPCKLGLSVAFNARVVTGKSWCEDDCSDFLAIESL